MDNIFVYGAGGQGKVVIDAIRSLPASFRIEQVVDDDPHLHGKILMGHPITSPEDLHAGRGFVAIGNNESRLKIAARFPGRLIVVAHRSAVLAPDVPVGEGSILLAGSIVQPGCRIGANVIVNTAASIDHDCVIEDGVHVAPGSRLCGNVYVGRGTLLGAGTIVVPGVRIGRDVFVHAGQVVTRDVPDGTTVRASKPRLAAT